MAQAEDCPLAYVPPFVLSQIGLAGAWLASSGSVLAAETGPPVGTVAKLEVCVCLLYFCNEQQIQADSPTIELVRDYGSADFFELKILAF